MAAAVDPTEARFPAVPAKAGHYESYYLKLCRPGEPLGAWIRYTIHKRPREAPLGSVWVTLFEAAGPRASKLTLPGPAVGGGHWIRVGEATIGEGAAAGAAEPGVAWDLRFETAEPPSRSSRTGTGSYSRGPPGPAGQLLEARRRPGVAPGHWVGRPVGGCAVGAGAG